MVVQSGRAQGPGQDRSSGERPRPRTDPHPSRRAGITPTSTASTTAPWPWAWSCCCPRSTRRLGVRGRQPGWTAPRCAVPASDHATARPRALPARLLPGEPSCPSPARSVQEKPYPRALGGRRGSGSISSPSDSHEPPCDVSAACRAPRRKGKQFLPPAGLGRDGQLCVQGPEPPLSSPSPTFTRKPLPAPGHRGALVSSPRHLFAPGNWHRRFCPAAPGSEHARLGSRGQQGQFCPQPGPACPRPPLWLGP